MTKSSINSLISQKVILCSLVFITSFVDNENYNRYSDHLNSGGKEFLSQSIETSKRHHVRVEINSKKSSSEESDSLNKSLTIRTKSDFTLDHQESNLTLNNTRHYADTVTVLTGEELVKEIRSNRVIKMVNNDYILKSTLLIDSISHLKIIGSSFSKLSVYGRNTTVLKVSNSHNIHLEKLIIGHTESPGYTGEQGVLRISYSTNIKISNCCLLGSGTVGLITYDVNGLNFSNSEITECSIFIFELEKSRMCEFKNSKFHNNHLAASVLGGFTNMSKEITFIDCDFLDNIPDLTGNPAFNFYNNWRDFDEPVVFTNSSFKNNKGFKWNGEKIKLDNCDIDSSDFVGFSSKTLTKFEEERISS